MKHALNRSQSLAALCVAAAAVTSLAACGGTVSNGSSNAKVVLGLSNSSVTSSFRGIMINSFKDEAEKLQKAGQISRYVIQNSGDDVSKQIQQIHNMVQSGVNVLVIDAQSASGLNAEIARSVAQGVTVVTTDNLATSDQSINVEVDPSVIAADTADGLAKTIGGKGHVLMLEGVAGTPVNEERDKLAKAVFAKYPNITVSEINVDWNPATSKQKTAQFISQNPDIAGVWDQGDSAGGAANAFIDAKKPLPPIVFDGTSDFLNIWHSRVPQGYQTVGATQPPAIIVDAIWLGLKAHQGAKVKQNPVLLKTPLLTNANVNTAWTPGMTDQPGQFVNPIPVPQNQLYATYIK
ncbi:MAG TPA: substrate-binding domain-containing protein [Streptosporangiaceae bacterium]|nr:substrate-binding domain-containing protein [Streptosporangiaceae bacterium]